MDSALAYRFAEQEKANVINYDFVKRINAPFQNPDLVIYLRIPVSVSVERAMLIGRPEPYSTDYLYKVKDYYDTQSENNPNYVTINADDSIDNITEAVERIIKEYVCDKKRTIDRRL